MTRVPRRESDEPAALLCRCDDWRFNDDCIRALISPNPHFASDSFNPRRFLKTSLASSAFYVCRAGILHIPAHSSVTFRLWLGGFSQLLAGNFTGFGENSGAGKAAAFKGVKALELG